MPQESKCMKKQKDLPTLELEDYSFNWNANSQSFKNDNYLSSDESVSEDESSTLKKKRKLSKQEKKEEERVTEKKLRDLENELMELDNNPQSADQFDRLLLGSPKDSKLWIKYMSFHLQATEFEKVRAVARKALQTIDIKEEQEKLNIWIALLNFENLYGTDESLSQCLGEAVRMNDDYQIYSKMLDIYVASKKNRQLEQLVNKMCKKFKNSLECWLHSAECLFNIKEYSKARYLLQRGLTCLTKKEHVTFISRFALLENKMGSSSEAQTLFEHVLISYPARTDIWSCYVDMLMKSNSVHVARQVLERACAQKLPPKKMKSLYTKRIAFEEKYGNEETVKKVKDEAMRYVSNYSKIFNE